MSKFNEDSRVKIPAILHLTRLGYEYLSLKDQVWDIDTNIFPDLFIQTITKINPELNRADAERVLKDTKLLLDNDDLGKAFYERITQSSGIKLIDFENFDNNSFHVVTELPCKNGDDEFRPDITLLINGMPLVFIEVKKPHNREGILAERNRINVRSQNPKFKRFINITQFMIFSNNMEYEDGAVEQIQGAFYASSSNHKPIFNFFREEDQAIFAANNLQNLSDETETKVLKDNNLVTIKNTPEFETNKNPTSPTNRICTSLLSRERLAFVLKYAFAYVTAETGIQKHIMRYPQIFATKAIVSELAQGTKKGVIWHTQGSGKTALAYYNVKHLTDYFQKQGIIPKFYFIVDRLDLLQQSQREFVARGLIVHTISSREDFARDIKSPQAVHNSSGKPEITVVNIQKFQEDPNVISEKDYKLNIQRIYFLDEVHRSYNPKGSFLANLEQSDPQAIKIGLTGTPLLGDEYNTRTLFGEYIHKYYYNASIADGYTLRLIREEISTQYKLELQKALEEAEIKVGSLEQNAIYSHPTFVEPMLDYIVEDFTNSRAALGDDTIGGMVICASSDQARQFEKLFNQKYAIQPEPTDSALAATTRSGLEREVAESLPTYQSKRQEQRMPKKAALILSDEGDKDFRKDLVDAFKAGKIDLLFVYNMLLTGFDAPRLKKLYLGRKIKAHSLLQALTRVNRTYKDFRYGYVVDFADISKEFKQTNEDYFKEFQGEFGDEMESYSNLFKTEEEIRAEIKDLQEILFAYNTKNLEVFSQQTAEIQDRKTVLELKKAIENVRSLYNLIRLQGNSELLKEIDINLLNHLYREVSNHLDLINLKNRLESGQETAALLNSALEETVFKFVKLGEAELLLADELKNTLRQTREALASNFDQLDPKFASLKEELERLFKNKKLSAVGQAEMNANIDSLSQIFDKINELNRQNNLLLDKYDGDVKYSRAHKRLLEAQQTNDEFKVSEPQIHQALYAIKQDADDIVLNNQGILNNENFFVRKVSPIVIQRFRNEQGINLTAKSIGQINQLIANEYINEFNQANQAW